MNSKSEDKNNNKSNVIQGLYFLIIAVISLISLSLAWFVTSKYGSLNDFQYDVGDAVEVTISVDDNIYYEDEIATPSNGTLFVPISGTGAKSNDKVLLWKPTVDDDTGAVVYSSGAYADTSDYLTFDVYLKLHKASQLVLGSSSAAEPCDVTARKSAFSNFSRDYIAGAVRVSFSVVSDGTEDLMMVWAPNPTYELQSTFTDNVETVTFLENGTQEASYMYYDGSHVVTASPSLVTSDTGGVLYEMSDAEKESAYVHLRIRVWIEGTDREAHTALSGGRFKLYLQFKTFMEE